MESVLRATNKPRFSFLPSPVSLLAVAAGRPGTRQSRVKRSTGERRTENGIGSQGNQQTSILLSPFSCVSLGRGCRSTWDPTVTCEESNRRKENREWNRFSGQPTSLDSPFSLLLCLCWPWLPLATDPGK